MGAFVDSLDFKPDDFKVAPKEEWRIMSMGHSKRSGTQPRFCAPNCEYYLPDADKKCKIAYECFYMVFDMHEIKRGESMCQVLFATENKPPFDGLSWWVSEKHLEEIMGKTPDGYINIDRGKKIVSAMIAEYNALIESGGITIN